MPKLVTAEKPRCAWPSDDALMIAYHDEEWGVPVRDGQALFAKLTLDGFQAGLSWRTILHKREAFLAAFHGFEPARISKFKERDVKRLLGDAGIVRHRGKIEAAIANARAYLDIEEREGFSKLLGHSSMERPRCIASAPRATFPPRRRRAGRCQQRCARGGCASSARPSATPSCRRWEWSTTI